jgi:hypothetical protein
MSTEPFDWSNASPATPDGTISAYSSSERSLASIFRPVGVVSQTRDAARILIMGLAQMTTPQTRLNRFGCLWRRTHVKEQPVPHRFAGTRFQKFV